MKDYLITKAADAQAEIDEAVEAGTPVEMARELAMEGMYPALEAEQDREDDDDPPEDIQDAVTDWLVS